MNQEWEKGFAQGFDDAMQICISEASLWKNENLKSLKNQNLTDHEILRLEGALSEIKAFKERIEEVLRSRNSYKEHL